MRSLFTSVAASAALALGNFLAAPAWAQSVTPGPQGVQIQGKTMDGQPFSLADHRGKVVLVMFWATDCAVCRDKMSELRQNAKGWSGQPFTYALISLDRRMSDVDDYNAIVNKSVPVKERLTQLWALDPTYKDTLNTVDLIKSRTATSLPLTLLLDKKGNVIKRYQGRIPSDVWNDIADLL